MALDPKDKKISDLEQNVKVLLTKTNELNRQVAFLVKENNRRKSEITQVVSAIKKG